VRYWLDTEFIETGRTIDLISIGVVCEDGREFYAENRDVNLLAASGWVCENVVPHLRGPDGLWPSREWGGLMPRFLIAEMLVDFVAAGDGKPEFWGYYADYDWVVTCWLYGRMIDLPDGWPMFCMDVKQLAVSLGNPDLPEQAGVEHHALADARWTKAAWEFLVNEATS
jgi:hypothetical protein